MDAATAEKVKKAFDLFGVNNFYALQQAYSVEDQRLFRAKLWDYDNPVLLINQAKEILKSIDQFQLTEEDFMWWHEILWLWHQHAISAAIWKKEKTLAQYYAARALAYQTHDHPNRVTRLLWHLVNERLEEAKLWAEEKIGPDHQTEVELIAEYEAGGGLF